MKFWFQSQRSVPAPAVVSGGAGTTLARLRLLFASDRARLSRAYGVAATNENMSALEIVSQLAAEDAAALAAAGSEIARLRAESDDLRTRLRALSESGLPQAFNTGAASNSGMGHACWMPPPKEDNETPASDEEVRPA